MAFLLPLRLSVFKQKKGPDPYSHARCSAVVPWLGALLGAAFFFWLYGFAIVRPTNIAWLLHGDPAQHYLGWAFFRFSPWQWPLGRIAGFGLPAGTTLVFTDSIPLLALLFKPFSAWLPAGDWQYMGGWMALCYTLQGALAAALLRRLGLDARQSLLGAGLLLLSPVLMLRAYGHEALMAQWLILAALLRYHAGWRGGVWLALLATAVLIHPYLFAMILPLATAAAWRARSQERNASSARLVVAAVVGVLVIGLVMAAAGYFTKPPGQLSDQGFGDYSANLLTWFDPMDWQGFLRHYGRPAAGSGEWSRLLPALGQVGDGQYEGFAYLGAGVLALALLALILTLRRVFFAVASRSPTATFKPLLVVALLLAVYSLSTRITFGAHTLIDIRQPHWLSALTGIFRASGRFVWPLTYLLITAAIVTIARALPTRWATGLLLGALLLQGADLGDKLQEFRRHFREPQPYVSPLADPAWSEDLAGVRRLVVMTDQWQGDTWLPFALLAARHGLATNAAYLARDDVAGRQRWLGEQRRRVDAGRPDPETLYVFDRPPDSTPPPGWRLQAADGWWLLAPSTN